MQILSAVDFESCSNHLKQHYFVNQRWRAYTYLSQKFSSQYFIQTNPEHRDILINISLMYPTLGCIEYFHLVRVNVTKDICTVIFRNLSQS